MGNAFNNNDNTELSAHFSSIDQYKLNTIDSIATLQSLPDLQSIFNSNDLKKITNQYDIKYSCQTMQKQYELISKQIQKLKNQYDTVINILNKFKPLNNEEMNVVTNNVNDPQQISSVTQDTQDTQVIKDQSEKPPTEMKTDNQITNNTTLKQDIETDTGQHVLECFGKIQECKYLDKLKQQLQSNDPCDNQIQSILNNFLHLLEVHDSYDEALLTEDFEYIYNKLGGFCDTKTCISFQRNNRNKDECKKETVLYELYDIKNEDKKDIYRLQIMDKIHCYFRHCYDIGCKLTADEKNKIASCINDIKIDDNDDEYNITKPNINKIQICKIIKNKHPSRLNKSADRYTIHGGPTKAFDFGEEFNYKTTSTIYSFKKYDFFKQELISNDLAILTVEQFDNELQKAILHYHSFYCRNIVKEYENRCKNKRARHIEHMLDDNFFENIGMGKDEFHSALASEDIKELKVHHLLALMIYCNFDDLQREWSKTYRKTDSNESKENLMKRHSTFYFLSKYLKESVCWFGAVPRKNDPIQFYHGIDEPLGFAKTKSVYMKCPLSATTCFSVAANFATHSGIVVEFTVSGSKPSYFAVSWLSDFGNEKEHLFVQSTCSLKIHNIVMLKNGCELKQILRSINILDNLRSYSAEYTTSECLLTNKLIHNELHATDHDKYKKFKSLDCYAAELMRRFCINKKKFIIDKDFINKGNHACLKKLFCIQILNDKPWINLPLICTLFPNLKEITIDYEFNCVLDEMMEDIFKHMKSKRLTKIYLRVTENCSHLSELENKFGYKFRNYINVTIEIVRYTNKDISDYGKPYSIRMKRINT